MVLIKDMKKPRSCSLCRLKDSYYGECNVKHKRVKTWIVSGGIPEWCPLVEITRCMDCEDYNKYRNVPGGECLRFGESAEASCPETEDGNDFCSWGEPYKEK